MLFQLCCGFGQRGGEEEEEEEEEKSGLEWSTHSEDYAWLSGLHGGEDMVFCALEHALEDREVGDDAAGVEVLVAVEDDFVAFRCDFQVRVSGVDGAADEVVVLDDEALEFVLLLVGSYDVCSRGPEKVVAQEHS